MFWTVPVFHSIHLFFILFTYFCQQCVVTVFHFIHLFLSIVSRYCFHLGLCVLDCACFSFYSHMFVIGVLILFSSWSLCVLDSACFSFYSPIFVNSVLLLFFILFTYFCQLCLDTVFILVSVFWTVPVFHYIHIFFNSV